MIISMFVPQGAIMILSSPLQHCCFWIVTYMCCHCLESYSGFCLQSPYGLQNNPLGPSLGQSLWCNAFGMVPKVFFCLPRENLIHNPPFSSRQCYIWKSTFAVRTDRSAWSGEMWPRPRTERSPFPWTTTSKRWEANTVNRFSHILLTIGQSHKN